MNNPKQALQIDNRHPVFLSIVDDLHIYGAKGLAAIAVDAEVGIATLYYWLNGTTRRPRIGTLHKVARVLGYEIVLQRRQAALRVV